VVIQLFFVRYVYYTLICITLPIPHPLEKFLFKKENDNVCQSSKRNCVGTSNAKNSDLYCVF